jgi:hypothetical protein
LGTYACLWCWWGVTFGDSCFLQYPYSFFCFEERTNLFLNVDHHHCFVLYLKLMGTRDLRTLWSPPVSLNQETHTGVHKARWAGQTGLGTSPGPTQWLPWLQSANVCEEHTNRQIDGGSRRSPCHALLLFLSSLLFSRPKSRSWYFRYLKSPTS